ncbi:MAG: hypothetical protein NC086_10820 [Alistipes sp.]|nr:hypothetical protein [Alistipes sp.]
MNIDEKKMKLIDEFMAMAKGRTPEEILPLILAVSKKSKQMGLTFTREETLYLVEQAKSSMPEKDRARVDMILNIML